LYVAGASGVGLTVGRGLAAQSGNVAFGRIALNAVTTGTGNTAIGDATLTGITAGHDNVAVGFLAAGSGTTKSGVVVVGVGSCFYATGSGNTAIGFENQVGNAGVTCSGARNTSVGYHALRDNTSGNFNTVVGTSGLRIATAGTGNTAIGYQSLSGLTTGNYNIAVGMNAGSGTTTGGGNISIGGMTAAGAWSPCSNFVASTNNTIVMGSTSVASASIQVAWTAISDARDKTNINSVPHGLDFVKKLKPISYQFKETRNTNKPNGPIRYGFKAQDILELEGEPPVITNIMEDGNKLGVTTDYLVPILVNAIQELTVITDNLQAKINALQGD